jgi:phage baseplate assembly protein W
LLLAATLLGSSSVLPDLGIVFPTIIDDSFARRVDVAIRSAASHMTDVEKVARINKVSVTTGSLGRVLVLIAYDDLTLGVSDSISVPIQ